MLTEISKKVQTQKFTDALAQAEAWDQANIDQRARLKDLSYGSLENGKQINEELGFTPIDQENSRAASLFGTGVTVTTEREWLELSDYARGQLCYRLDAPPQKWLFGDKCDAELRAQILQYQINKSDPEKEILLRQRSLNGQRYVRAVLSDRFGKFDHFKYLSMIADAMRHDGTDPDRFEISRFYLGNSMSMMISIPMDLDSGLNAFIDDANLDYSQDERDRGWGQHGGIRRAVIVGNSEIGSGSWYAYPAIWRQVCGNGMQAWVQGVGFSGRHIGTETAQVMVIADTIAQSFKFSKELAEGFVATQAVKLNRTTIGDLLDSWTNKYSLPIGVADAMKERSQGRDTTLWHQINYLTEMARDTESDQVRDDLEKVAGELVFATINPVYLAA